jgi:hypothetical protein
VLRPALGAAAKAPTNTCVQRVSICSLCCVPLGRVLPPTIPSLLHVFLEALRVFVESIPDVLRSLVGADVVSARDDAMKGALGNLKRRCFRFTRAGQFSLELNVRGSSISLGRDSADVSESIGVLNIMPALLMRIFTSPQCFAAAVMSAEEVISSLIGVTRLHKLYSPRQQATLLHRPFQDRDWYLSPGRCYPQFSLASHC